MNLESARIQGHGHALGESIGARFSRAIRDSLAGNEALRGPFTRFNESEEGRSLFRRLLALHTQRYPDYVAEIEGLAAGASVPFDDLFIANLRGEYRGFTGIDDAGECSTCAIAEGERFVLGHNEDGSAIYRGRAYLLHVEPDAGPTFTAVCYPGFLPGNAFGFNEHALCFSVNNVRPRHVREGLGRHFMARSLFGASSLEEALASLSVEPRSAGFNYTIASRRERRMVNVEVAPDRIDVHEVTHAHFHANHYLYLDVEQTRFPSSLARQARGEALVATTPPADARAVLAVLRDQGDRELPIWRDGAGQDQGVTLLSAVFDLDEGLLSIYPGPGGETAAGEPVAQLDLPR